MYSFFANHAHFQDRAVQAARLSLVQVLINSKGLQMNPLQSLYYVSPACLLCLSVPFGKGSPPRYLANDLEAILRLLTRLLLRNMQWRWSSDSCCGIQL